MKLMIYHPLLKSVAMRCTGYTLAYGQAGIFTNGKQSVHIREIRQINIDR
jgi:hypothetical protein